MKKTYTTPTTIVNGRVTCETMGIGSAFVESGSLHKSPDGSVGFHL
jgi:hypothetical protein